MPLLRIILRCTFYTTAALSTLLLMATLTVWPVSYYFDIGIRWDNGHNVFEQLGGNCRAEFVILHAPSMSRPFSFHHNSSKADFSNSFRKWSYLSWTTSKERYTECSTTAGISQLLSTDPDGSFFAELDIPFSYLTLLFSLLPLLAFRSLRRRRKAARPGLCPKCHYDLRAHHAGTAGPVCPECGTPVAGRRPSPVGAGGLSGLSGVVALPEAAGRVILAGAWVGRWNRHNMVLRVHKTMAPGVSHAKTVEIQTIDLIWLAPSAV